MSIEGANPQLGGAAKCLAPNAANKAAGAKPRPILQGIDAWHSPTPKGGIRSHIGTSSVGRNLQRNNKSSAVEAQRSSSTWAFVVAVKVSSCRRCANMWHYSTLWGGATPLANGSENRPRFGSICLISGVWRQTSSTPPLRIGSLSWYTHTVYIYRYIYSSKYVAC